MLISRCSRRLIIFAFFILSFSRAAFATGLEFDRNLHLGSWSPFASYWEGRSPVCVWTQTEDVGFRIIAINQSNTNEFQLVNGIGDGVSFSLFWEDFNNPQKSERLKAGTPSTQTYFFNQSYGCGISPNYMMRLRVNKADLDSAMPGIYQGALVLILSPI